MSRARYAAVGLAVVAAASCTTTNTNPSPPIPRGGTLHVVVVEIPQFLPPGIVLPDNSTLDALTPPLPFLDTLEILRCCLARTLLSYVGKPTLEGGGDLRPDLAVSLPDVAADGLTWTVHIKSNLHYGPPLQGTQITSGDFVRGLQRTARVGSMLPAYYSAIVGYDDYSTAKTASIAGLQTPDPFTLVIHLSQPEGDLGYRLSLPYAAPLPPLPTDARAPYGVATGHDGTDGGFLVSSGPYMVDGSEKLNFSVPAAQQVTASGLVVGKSVTLVRNPSWHSGDDPLRPAYVDRIVVKYSLSKAQAVADVGNGSEDIMLSPYRPPQVTPDVVRAYEADPSRGRVVLEARDSVRYISMNLSRPPFDDVHVRRAVAFALDRTALQDVFGGSLTGTVTGHLALDSMEDNALLMYNPYRTADAMTRLRMARLEMAQSKYDSLHAGNCDAVVCQHVAGIATISAEIPPAMSAIVTQDLAQVGIHLDVTNITGDSFFTQAGDPTMDPAMALFWSWGKDYPNGSDFFVPQYSSTAFPNGFDVTLIGASAQQLSTWGYPPGTTVPSVDDRINACLPLVGDSQTRCWTALDQYLMEKVVAVIPLSAENYVEVVPKRVVHYSFDQFVTLPALDQIAVAG
jgi:peptide/nickel transport system substrate-binding protein